MHKFFIVLLFSSLSFNLNAQVGVGTSNIDPSAMFQVESNDKGILIPKVALTSATDIVTVLNPVNGLLIFNTSTTGSINDSLSPGFYFYNGSEWTRLLNSGDESVTNIKVASDAAIDFTKLNIIKSDITGLGIPAEDTDTTYSAGEGLELDGTSFSINSNVVTSTYGGSLELSGKLIANQGIETVGTITATTFVGDGSRLTGISVDDTSISNSKLADGSVTNSKLSDNTITESKLADESVTNIKVASDAAIDFTKLNIIKSDITGLGIPAEDTDTTYSAGEGLELDGTSFSINSNVVTSTYGGSLELSGKLIANQGIETVGTVTATTFVGDGSRLTGTLNKLGIIIEDASRSDCKYGGIVIKFYLDINEDGSYNIGETIITSKTKCSVNDLDGDGVIDEFDKELYSPLNSTVDSNGVSFLKYHDNGVTIIASETATNTIYTLNNVSYYVVSGKTDLINQINNGVNASQLVTSKVTDMKSLFLNNSNFNDDISSWDTSNVTTMEGMFFNASNFNQNIGNWDTSKVESMRVMFWRCGNFNQNINDWDTSSVTNMSHLFYEATSFNSPINKWNVENVTNMAYMFKNATNFDQNIEDWNVGKVIDMRDMFSYATNFNQNLNEWNVSNVTNMAYMFNRAGLFNKPLNNWDTSSVERMTGMFSYATNFNQNLSMWCVSRITEYDDRHFFYNYSALVSDNRPKWGQPCE